MRLGINVVRLTRAFTGVGRYIECLLTEWAAMSTPFESIVLYAHSPLDRSAASLPLDTFRLETVGRKLPDPLWEWKELRRKRGEMDVLFCPSYTVPVGYRGRCVVTYHGPPQNRFFTREWWRHQVYERLYRYSCRRADHVLANSQSVAERVEKVYRVGRDRITVTYLAAGPLFRPVDNGRSIADARQRYVGGDHPFLLFVGKLTGRHHIPELLRAFRDVKRKHAIPHKLLMVGPCDAPNDPIRLATRLEILDSVCYVPYIPNRELPPVYCGAELMVYPTSEVEGFGLPVIEAMACGTPVVSTDTGSLSEIARGAAFLTRTPLAGDLEQALAAMLFDDRLRADLAEKGRAAAARFSWRKTAEQTMDVLAEIARK